MIDIIILIVGLILSFLMEVSLGGNDAAEPTDAAVGAGVISIKKAVILFAIFTAVGALTQGFMVMKTIGKGIVPEISIAGAFASVTAAVIWVNLVASKLGIDVSVTHSITGAVFGYGLVAYGFSMVNSNIMYLIILSWVSSPFASIFLAYILYKVILALIRSFDINVFDERVERALSYLLIFSLIFSAFAFGTNDIANATGVYVTIAEKLGRMPDYNAMLILAAFGSLGVAIGGYFIGPRVISTMAYKITRLDILTALAAEMSNALVVYLFTTIPYMTIGFGLPISTSLASAGSLIGVGLAAGGRSNVDKKIVTTLASFWVLTVPVTMIISGGIYYILHVLLGLQ